MFYAPIKRGKIVNYFQTIIDLINSRPVTNMRSHADHSFRKLTICFAETTTSARRGKKTSKRDKRLQQGRSRIFLFYLYIFVSFLPSFQDRSSILGLWTKPLETCSSRTIFFFLYHDRSIKRWITFFFFNFLFKLCVR